MTHPIDPILNPRTIAIVGASSDPSKRGYRAIRALLDEGYDGRIYAINPREKEILGIECHPSVTEVPEPIDLAFVCTPAASAPAIINQCGEAGVRGALIVAGGFGEASEKGRQLEEETLAIAKRFGVRLIGPNTGGLHSSRRGCNTLGIDDVPRGGLVMVANSANVILSMVTEAQHGDMGIHTMLSIGNQLDIEFHEYLECFGEDPEVKAIVSYVEGFSNAPAYIAMARKVALTKPIVMYVAGRSEEGKKAAKSHSGSLAGEYEVSKGVLSQAGITLLTRSDELYPVSEALSLLPPMAGRRVGLLSEGGGAITVAAEALAERGLILAQLSDETREKIHSIVPNASAISNPVDSGGGTDVLADYCGPIARAMIEDPNIDALLIVGFFGGYGIRLGPRAGREESNVAAELVEMMKRYKKPIIVQSHYKAFKPEPLRILRAGGVPVQRHIEIAVQCIASAADYGVARARLSAADMPAAAAHHVLNDVLHECYVADRPVLESEARTALRSYGINVPAHIVMRSSEDGLAAIDAFGSVPCAMKILSRDILHKTESGGVMLNVSGRAEIEQAYTEMMDRVAEKAPDAVIDGVLVTPMVEEGVELIIGATRDPQYGPVMMFGIGGIFVEAVRDVIFRSIPLTGADVDEMIGGLKHSAILNGFRGRPPVDKSAIRDLILGISDFYRGHPEVAEIDLNPIIATESGCRIVDVRLVLEKQEPLKAAGAGLKA